MLTTLEEGTLRGLKNGEVTHDGLCIVRFSLNEVGDLKNRGFAKVVLDEAPLIKWKGLSANYLCMKHFNSAMFLSRPPRL